MSYSRKGDRRWHWLHRVGRIWWGWMQKPWGSGASMRNRRICIWCKWGISCLYRHNKESLRLKSKTERHYTSIWRDGMCFVISVRSSLNTLFSKKPKETERILSSLALSFKECWDIWQTGIMIKKSKYLLKHSAASRLSEFNLESNDCSWNVEKRGLKDIRGQLKSKFVYQLNVYSVMNYVGLSMQF